MGLFLFNLQFDLEYKIKTEYDLKKIKIYNVYVHVQPMRAIMYWGVVNGGVLQL